MACCIWVEGTAKGGRHGQTRLSFHGDSHVGPHFLDALLGRNASLPALRRNKSMLEDGERVKANRSVRGFAP